MSKKNIRTRLSFSIFAILGIVVLFGVLGFSPDMVNAQQEDFGLQAVEDSGIGLSGQPLDVTIAKLIRILLGFLGLVAVIIVIYGGYMYMTAAGNEDRIARAKLILRNGVIGLAIILFSFIIVQFVIQKLMQASGIGDPNDGDPTCVDIGTCNNYSCYLNTFGVQSITPSQDNTGMNNIVVRAVFSKGVATPPEDVLQVTIGGGNTDITKDLTFTVVPDSGQKVIEGRYTFVEGDNNYCNTFEYAEGTACIPLSDTRSYNVEVNDNIVALDGQGIAFGQVCEDFNSVKEVDFFVDVEENDIEPPMINSVGVVNSQTNQLYTSIPPYLIAGRKYVMKTDVDDNNGIGYVHLRIQATEDAGDVFDFYRGPAAGASSADPYTLAEELFLSSGITKKWGQPKEYDMTATVWDIDNNSSVATSSFVLLGAHCDNGKQDEKLGETGVDIGGACGNGPKEPCIKDIQCASGKCIDSQCIAYPKITNVDPMDGAPGNWVTVIGNYFGYDEGKIEFGLDETGWITANLVECPGIVDGNSWHDSFAIVEVPQAIKDENGGVNGAIALTGNGHIELIPSEIRVDQIDEGWTFGVWIKLEDTVIDDQTLFAIGDVNDSIELKLKSDKHLVLLQIEDGEVSTVVESTSEVDTFDNKQWVFVALAEHESGRKLVYVNKKREIFSGSSNRFQPDDQVLVRLGASFEGHQKTKGSFDEAIVMLDYAHVSWLYNRLYPVFLAQTSQAYEDVVMSIKPDPPVMYWKLGDQDGSALKESISDISSGTVVGEVLLQADGIFGAGSGDIVSEVAIRITPKNGQYFDTTIDVYGPKPGDKDGYFSYNDIQRPGLCAVVADGIQGTVNNGDLAAPSGSNIRAHGTGFGNEQVSGDQILFDINVGTGSTLIAGDVRDWTEEIVKTSIPINFSPGNPLVKVKKGVEFSNGIPFKVTKADLTDIKPLITNIDPEDPTPGSFVTIYGNNFGVAGVVYISKEKGAECSYEGEGIDEDGCIQLDYPPLPCENTWTNTQIIVDIEETFSDLGTYYVIVERADNHLQSDGLVDILSIQQGEPRPSICSLSPVQGPAPLPTSTDAHPGLTFKGKNFTETPVLYFWNGSQTYSTTTEEDANPDISDAWIGWDGSADTVRWQVNSDGTQIISSIAYQSSSLYPTMPFGQWPITIMANSVKGNSVKYFVSDCRTQDEAPNTDFHCCTEGPDTGSWKYICDGETRNSGYVWRFTTGIFPNTPYVLEQCDEVNWYDGEYDGKNPSPVPSIEWEESEDMCLNATVQVALSMGLDQTTITTDSVFVYECGDGDEIDCDYYNEDILSDLDLLYETGEEHLLIIEQGDLSGEANFAPGTWHRVILTTDILSSPQDIGAGVTSSMPLQIDRPLGEFDKGQVAFYYDFQTGSGFCTLNSAFITPKEKTVSKLGLLKDIWYPDLPFYYYLKGRADRKCTVLSVDKLGWQWESNKPNRGEIEVAPSPLYADSRATATAIVHTPKLIGGVEFSADTTPSTTLATFFPPDGVIIAETSTLYIDLGKPQVIYYEPNCAEACPNGMIFAQFNRHMDPDTFRKDSIILSECLDPNCIGLDNVEYTFENADSVNEDDWLYVKIIPDAPLMVNTYYKVVLNERVKSLGQLKPSKKQDGEELKYHEWIFRTKQDGTLCAVDHVDVTPNPFTAVFIGQKTKFTATPYGAPSECSATGQELNRWDDYEYQWTTSTPGVANITTFEKSLSSKTYCTQACLPTGSDVSFSNKKKPLCGNTTVDAGEDCDIAASGEIINITCTLDCLRPGSSALYCGGQGIPSVDNPEENGVSAGELCDPTATIDGVTSWKDYCTNDCKLKGSSKTFNPAVSGFCGDGEVGYEEACDIAISLEDAIADPDLEEENSKIGCNTSCLHTGTPLSASWCENEADLTNLDTKAACQFSKSVCGNGMLELGEQCERTETNKLFCSPLCRFYDGDLSDNNEKNGQIGICGTTDEQCTAGSEGCTKFCTFAGSSLFYSTPSLCGDGVNGIGEENTSVGSPVCEVLGEGTGNNTEAPLQIATAIGEGVVTSGTQKTDIKVKMPLESKNGAPVEGFSDYTLQCGFTEFDEPINGFYNDCVIPPDYNPPIPSNGFGVAYNSCCSTRPVRETEYPVDGAGLVNEEPVCRNTYIEVTFTGKVDPSSFMSSSSVRIVRGYETFKNCTALGGEDVTDIVIDALDRTSGIVDAKTGGFWSTLWNGVKQFFLRLFGGDVHAKDVLLKNIKTWCTENIVLTTNMYEPSETVPLYISNVLGEDNKHTAYAVLLEGGNEGIRDISGVGIKHKTKAIVYDAWAFEVGTKICKIDEVKVDPSSYLFSQPSISADVGADAVTDTGQLIVPTPPYNWKWAWQPQANTVFDIPVDGYPSDSQFTKLGSTNVEGSVTAVAQTIITEDVSPENNHKGKIFEGEVKLTSLFCENPWPPVQNGEWYPYKDDMYRYSFSYCADAGQSDNLEDDLPFLEGNEIDIVLGGTCSATLNACAVAAECQNTYEMGSRTYVGNYKKGLCEFSFDGSIWQAVKEIKPGPFGTTYYAFGCNEAAECQSESLYTDESTHSYYEYLLPSIDVSGLDLSSNIASATCNTTRPIKKQQCEGITAGALEKTLFVSDTNTDGLGIQIFENPNRLSAAAWFADRFPTASLPQQVEIAGYDAVADQDNYYVNALNIVRDESDVVTAVYNNIYLFSISQGSQESTRDVFGQILDSLEFNTNLTDHEYCIGYDNETPDYINSCTTDFDCILGIQTEVLSEAKEGVCSIDDTKTWVKKPLVKDEDISTVSMSDSQHVWFGGVEGSILHTSDGGKTIIGIPSPFTDQITDMVFVNQTEGWMAVDGNGIYKTEDSGQTWNEELNETGATVSTDI
ncbi:hypothetical protein HN682_03220, partial [Candidatus Peregrinibacteria bacterium]|nr:hypothetical protein [Candidatus Peregrinibacteria bacterium]